ncbi:MAG: D-glycero-D-manno-heptose 1,7-bisphosphate phosphatase [Myxococcota bacterium]
MTAARPSHVLLDRDGVLNIERDGVAITEAALWQWQAGSREAVRALVAAGVHVAVATNQSIVGRGQMTRPALDAMHRELLGELGLDFVVLCPHAPDAGCDCRKPAPGLLEQAVARWEQPARGIVFVGDSHTDWRASQALEMPFVLVRTGKGAATEQRLTPAEVSTLQGGKTYDTLSSWVAETFAGSEERTH